MYFSKANSFNEMPIEPPLLFIFLYSGLLHGRDQLLLMMYCFWQWKNSILTKFHGSRPVTLPLQNVSNIIVRIIVSIKVERQLFHFSQIKFQIGFP